MSKVSYYVTNAGLAAALASPDITTTMQGILTGSAHPMTVRSFAKRGWIELDKRGALRTDHNTLVLTGAVERVREVLTNSATPTPPSESNGHGKPAGKPTTTYALSTAGPTFSPTVEKVRAVLASFTGPTSFKEIAAHADLAGMNPGTLRWAIQVLRRAGVCESKAEVAA